MNKPFLALLVLSVTFLLTPALVLAQSSSQIVDFIWVRTFGFERQWLNNPNQLILQALLPAVAIYAIVLGMMRTIRLSYGMGNIEHLIAVVIMLAALFTGGIGWISAWLSALGQIAVGVFILLFFVGIGLYSWGYIRSRKAAADELAFAERRASTYLKKELASVMKNQKSLFKKAAPLPTGSEEREKLIQKIEDLEKKRKELIGELKEVEEEYLSLPAGLSEMLKKKK